MVLYFDVAVIINSKSAQLCDIKESFFNILITNSSLVMVSRITSTLSIINYVQSRFDSIITFTFNDTLIMISQFKLHFSH